MSFLPQILAAFETLIMASSSRSAASAATSRSVAGGAASPSDAPVRRDLAAGAMYIGGNPAHPSDPTNGDSPSLDDVRAEGAGAEAIPADKGTLLLAAVDALYEEHAASCNKGIYLLFFLCNL